jgi:hypothetical protein
MKYQTRKFHSLSIFLVFLIGTAFSSSVVGALSFFESSLERVNNEGAVKVSVVYLTPEKSPEKGVAFKLTLSTHSVDLDQYNIQKLSFVRVDGGVSLPSLKWVPAGAGHHLQGTLRFAEELPAGNHRIELIVKGIDGVKERIFKWQLPVEK